MLNSGYSDQESNVKNWQDLASGLITQLEAAQNPATGGFPDGNGAVSSWTQEQILIGLAKNRWMLSWR
jgi:hypothetical protein